MLQVSALWNELDTLKKEHEQLKSELSKVRFSRRACPFHNLEGMHWPYKKKQWVKFVDDAVLAADRGE